MSQAIDPLLSSVSVMLAAFGFFYNTQQERIEAAASDTKIPDDTDARKSKRDSVAKTLNVARMYTGVALLMWVLLLPEIVSQVKHAFQPEFDVGRYSTPNVIFFVAANAWLAAAGFLYMRARAVHVRVNKLG